MIFALFQLVTIVLVAVYLAWCDIALHWRNKRSWDAIAARLRPDPDATDTAGADFWRDRPRATTGRALQPRPSRRSLWIQFVNAGVFLEMADFARRNGRSGDAKLLDNLHMDAIYIRAVTLVKLVRRAFPGPARAYSLRP